MSATLIEPSVESPIPPNLAWSRFTQEPAPDWIQAVKPPQNASTEGGATWLLLDEQIRLRPEEERYRRTVFRVDNETGVDWLSEIQIAFNPSYEALTLHGVVVVREGKSFDALLDADIDFVRVERDMHARVYRGDYSVIIQIRGLEPGDLIDTAFTVTGANPVFEGRPLQHIRLDFPQAIGRHRIRVANLGEAGAQIFKAGREVSFTTV